MEFLGYRMLGVVSWNDNNDFLAVEHWDTIWHKCIGGVSNVKDLLSQY
jgi:hypothetical protein